ncbi:unnamed protein product [Larinioides sclopetarius]|uniref:Cytochrome-b5 reductase n=1 Tax=Larinioides sclopetarius TaxID=280406 RepID=A0AAV2BC89_9ARAC
MDNCTSTLTIPVSSAAESSTGRNKVALKPGRSLMDWIRYTHSRNDLAGTGGRCLEISPRELAKHSTRTDAWIALRGKVYNITHYLEYHPGGEDELMRGAGKDATDLFNQVHRWVNAESMLQKCFIGILKKTWSLDVPRFPPLKHLKVKHKKAITLPDGADKESETISKKESKETPIVSDNKCNETLEEKEPDIQRTTAGKSEWSVSPYSKPDASKVSVGFDEDGSTIKLLINCSTSKLQGLITDLVDRKLFIRFDDSLEITINFEFSTAYKEDFKVDIVDNKFVEIALQKQGKTIIHDITSDEVDAKSQVVPCQSIPWNIFEPTDELIFWSCKLTKKIHVNHNTFLCTFLLPPGTKMWVPLGRHVHIRSYIEGMEVIRSYTPVVSSLDVKADLCDELDGCKLVLMIKIYPTGIMTPVINQCNLGESLWISNYAGNFSDMLLMNCDSAIMLAAGTGITPMIRLIYWIITAKDKRRSILLLFFNKTEEDIIWRQELQNCVENYSEFQVIHVLSEPSEMWSGFSGKINDDLISQLLTVKLPELKQQLFVCGPSPFTEAALRCLEGVGYNQDDVYVFTGS